MAVQKIAPATAAGDRHAGRPGQNPVIEQGGLAALTTTLLAGAVTGAVAGVVEARREVTRDEPERDHSGLPDDASPTRPEGAGPTPREPAQHAAAGDEKTVDGATHSAVDRAEFPKAAAANDAGIGGERTVETGIAALAPTSAGVPAAATSAGGRADGGNPLVPGGAATAPVQSDSGSREPEPVAGFLGDQTAAIDQAFARLDADPGRIAETFAARPQEIAVQLSETIGTTISTIIAEAGGTIDTLSAVLEETLSASADALQAATEALPTVLAIPVTLLGSDVSDRQPDGILSLLFDGAEKPASAGAPMSVREPTETSTGGGVDLALPELAGAIEAISIGFAGQSYTEAQDGHDAPGGSQAGLFHGLI
jgi:hypothetical protein